METADMFRLLPFLYDTSLDVINTTKSLPERFPSFVAGVIEITASYSLVLPQPGKEELCANLCQRNNLNRLTARKGREILRKVSPQDLENALQLVSVRPSC